MLRGHRDRRLLLLALAFALIVAACGSGGAEDTVPATVAPLPTTTTSSTTTTTTIPLTPNGPPIVREGDRNATVEALQFLINCNGLGQLTVDGAFGPATASAVEAVQVEFGREVTGAPDDETFALLSRGCSEDRRVEIDEDDEGEQTVVGNAAGGDVEIYFIRAEEGERLSVVIASETGGAVANVRTADGSAVGPSGVTAWAAEIETTGDFVVEVSATDAVTFVATFAVGELDIDDVSAADTSEVIIDDLDSSVTGTCLDTTGDNSFVADTPLGHLIVSTGRPGVFGIDRGGVGAPVEFVFRDGSPGYYGFDLDLDIEVGDTVTGTGIVFFRESGSSDEPLGLAFDFDRPVAPCEGGEGTTVVLHSDGLGVVDFGADPDETIETVRAALLGASASIDTDWVTIDNLSNEFGVCRQGTTEVRSVQIDNLTLFFTNAGTTFGAQGTRHFAAYVAEDGVFPFKTGGAVGPGDTIERALAAHPEAAAASGLTGGIDVYISSPPGSDQWLRATAGGATSATDTEAVITSVSGGRFCDN